jgi:hypothetical protein
MTTTNRFAGRARRWLIVLALAGFATFGGACNRAHLSSYYGQSFNAWFAMQHVRSEPADTDATRRASTLRRPPPSPRTTAAPSVDRVTPRRGRW